MIPVAAIVLRQDNPRQAIDADELALLARAIEADGLQNRIIVRECADVDPPRYELWQGERRLRAARDILKRKSIEARVYDALTPDAEMIRGRALENIARADLNPVEEAQSYQQMLAAGSFPTQKALGQALGISGSEVANRLGLLRLPAEWQARVISCEMSPAHARALVPWVHRPAVLEAVAAAIEVQRGWNDDPYSTQQNFRDEVAHIVLELSRSLQSLTPKQRQDPRLDVEDVPGRFDAKRSERRAFNLTLWNEFTQSRAAKASGRDDAGDDDAPAEASPAERRAKAKQQAEQLAAKVARYKRAWLQPRIAARIVDTTGACVCDVGLLFRLLLYFTTTSRRERDAELARVVTEVGGRRKHSPRHGVDVWGTLATLQPSGRGDPRLLGVVAALVAQWVQADAEGWNSGLLKSDVVAIATECGVDLAAEWRVEEAFLLLCTKAQLVTLAEEWQIGRDVLDAAGDKRSDLIAALLEADQRMHLPAPKLLLAAQ